MPLRDIKHLINTASDLAMLREKSRKQMLLQQAFVDLTPVELAELTRASRVGYIKAGTLYLLADNPAVAAKLRQLLPRLLPLFRKLEPEVTGIKVRVQVKFPPKKSQDQLSRKSLPEDFINKFKALSHTIRDPKLKSAMQKLIRKRPNQGH